MAKKLNLKESRVIISSQRSNGLNEIGSKLALSLMPLAQDRKKKMVASDSHGIPSSTFDFRGPDRMGQKFGILPNWRFRAIRRPLCARSIPLDSSAGTLRKKSCCKAKTPFCPPFLPAWDLLPSLKYFLCFAHLRPHIATPTPAPPP